MQKRGFIWLKATMYDFKTHAKHTRAFVLLQKRTESDIDCLDEKELVSEIVGMTNTEGGQR